jgi:hypothetical protein
MITWGTVLGGPTRVRELAHRTIDLFGVQAGRIYSYEQGQLNLDSVNTRPLLNSSAVRLSIGNPRDRLDVLQA